jgi:pyruvate,orthophosphate dikinase
VNCTNLDCNENEKYCEFHQVRIKSGEHISIDGQEGSVYRGLIRVKET